MSSETKEKESPKITTVVKSEKVKDPKRVEAGKRLAAISKEAKERKMRERINAEKGPDDGYAKSEYLIGLAGVAIGAVTLYLAYNSGSDGKTERVTREKNSMEPKEEPPKILKNNSLTKEPVLDTFDE